MLHIMLCTSVIIPGDCVRSCNHQPMHFLFLAIFSQITALHVFNVCPCWGPVLDIFQIVFNSCLNRVKPCLYVLFSILEKLLKKRSQTSAQPAAAQGAHKPPTQPSSLFATLTYSPYAQENVNIIPSYLDWEIKVRHECCGTWPPVMLYIFTSLEDSVRCYLMNLFSQSVDSVCLILSLAITLLGSCKTLHTDTNRDKLKYIKTMLSFSCFSLMVAIPHIFQVLDRLSKVLQTDSLMEIQKWLLKASLKGNELMHLHPCLQGKFSCIFV